jgi:hypothetical protein
MLSTDSYSQNPVREDMEKDKPEFEPLVLVINYPYQIWSNDPTKIHLTLFKPDFKPAYGAKVTVNGKLVGKADKNGVCIFDYVPGSGESHDLEAILKEGKKTYKVFKNFACNSRTVSFKADRLYIYTDRGVYNPGQDILIRAIAWQLKGEYTPIPKAEIQLLLQDKNGKVFSGENITTNDYGVAATQLSLPENMPEGDYELVVLYEQVRESASIRIKRFVPPIINIKHDLKRYFTNSQKTFEAKVDLSYFSGGEIKSSNLVFSVLTLNNEEVFSKSYSAKKPEYAISFGETILNKIRSTLTLESSFKIKLLATDSYGQSDEIIWDITYTARPYSAVLEIDKDSYLEGEMVQILAKIVDIDNQPAVNIPLVLEISEIELKKEAKTDEKGVAVLEFKMPDHTVTAIVKSPIMEPVLASRTIPFQARKPMVSKASEPPKGAGTKTSITVEFDKDYVPVEKVVHVDMTDVSGALVISTTIPVKEKKSGYVAEGKVTAPTWGTMLVNLYCCAIYKDQKGKELGPEVVGFITEGQHITFYPDRELEISVKNFKPSVAPGEKVSFRVQVRGGKGEKCLGIALVDDAVISLLDPFIKDPIDHFYHPQVKVISTGGAGVLTWPVVDRNWGSPWRDIAYTNWGWKAPGGFVGYYDRDAEYEGAPPEATQSAEGAYYDDYDAGGIPANGEDELLMEKAEEAYPVSEPKAALKKGKTAADKLDGGEENGDEEVPKKTIIIRTHFPETALWEPLVMTKKGEAEITLKIPDALTTQKFSVVATDMEGFIGFLRKDITVTQPLYVRSAFPATMTLDDEITVQAVVKNLGNKSISCTAKLESDDLDIIGSNKVKLSIAKNDAAIAEWTIRARACGKNEFTVSCETDDFMDSEQKSIFVVPAGEPKKQLVRGSIKGAKDAIWEASFTTDDAATYLIVNLNVSMPNVFPAFQAWWAFDTRPWYSPWATAATAIMNTAMLEYATKMGGDAKFIAIIKKELSEATSQLTSQQFPSGAWGWYFLADATAPSSVPIVGGENLYYTVYVLRALAEIKKSGMPVDDGVMLRAVDYIMKSRNKHGLWSSKGAYFWQVFNEETDQAFSAETFEVLMLTAMVLPGANKYDAEFQELKNAMVSILKERSQEPMAIAAAVQGLSYWKQYKSDKTIDKLLNESIAYLVTLKRTGYWEPHWYHAYGGMVELNARILELLATYDPDKYDAFLREGVTWLLSTREAWGAWHNEIGTANAIRALLKTGAFAEEKKSQIALVVNGKEVAEIDVDPKDPFLSAAKLRYFEITPWVKDGKNDVAVTYNGNLTASVLLEIQEWGTKVPEAKEVVEIKRLVPREATVGEPVKVTIKLNSKEMVPIMTIEDHIPANGEVDRASLDALKKAQAISDYMIEGNKLYMVLVQVKGTKTIEYKLKATRTGNALHAGTRIIDAANGDLLAMLVSTPFTVK